MPAPSIRTAACLLALVLPAAAACAGSSASSAASDAGSASLGSSAASSARSSESSVTRDTAAGDYEIIEVTADAGDAATPGHTRLRLAPLAAAAAAGPSPQAARSKDTASAGSVLFLPPQTVARAGLAAGDVITARSRPYGLEFARRDAAEPFFLVLTDDWFRGLQTRPVTL